jgi:hypothetical protein
MAGRNDEPIYVRQQIRPPLDTEEGQHAAAMDLFVFFFLLVLFIIGHFFL